MRTLDPIHPLRGRGKTDLVWLVIEHLDVRSPLEEWTTWAFDMLDTRKPYTNWELT